MLNHYEILGIPRNADSGQIKSAFKRLALKYHPDRNPGNVAAEEYFKQLNEAYQVLSDLDKKRRYDFILNYSYQTTQTTSSTQQYRYSTRKKTNTDKTVYDRYGKFDWRNAPRYKKAPKYKIDRNYYKLQAYAMGIMLALSALILSVNLYWNYLKEKDERARQQQNEITFRKAQNLYNNGEYRSALEMITQLDLNNPIESIYYQERERMVSGLFQSAVSNFKINLYQEAARQLEIVKEYEQPMKMQTWEMLADSYLKLENYDDAVAALGHMLARDKHDIRLTVKLARIYNNQLNNTSKAMEYYDEAKLLFKEFQSAAYGPAFEIIMDPSKLPDFYHDLFQERAQINYKLGHYEVALTDCNWAIFLRPQFGATYNMRAHCQKYLGYKDRACRDWIRAIEHGHDASRNELNKYCQ